jgi:carboxymethylenebutenolidase
MIDFEGALNPARPDVGAPAARGTGYLVEAAGDRAPGVLLLHPWWGLNATVRGWADELGGHGYSVLAPDMFGGRVATTIDEAQALVDSVEGDEAQLIAVEQIGLGSARHLAQLTGGPIGVVGFSFGAAYGLWLSRKLPDEIAALVLFYGTGGPPGDGRCPVLGHYASDDPYETAENVVELENALREAGRLEELHRYAGTAHWFAEPDRPEFNAAAAALAWQRTLAFLARVLPA